MKEELGPTRGERLKNWFQRIERSKGESTEKRILLLFGLGKEIKNEYTRGGSKKDKTIARRLFASFKQTYPRMPFNEEWRL